MPLLLVFRSNWDLATRYGHAWLGVAKEEAVRAGWDVHDLEGSMATKEGFHSALLLDPDFVVAMGHGNHDTFTGQGGEVVFKACENDGVLAGRIAYMLSCFTGQELGPSAVGKDCTAYMGYISDFRWVIHPDYAEEPLSDPYAYWFMQAALEPVRAVLGGASMLGAYRRTLDKFEAGIRYWWGQEDPQASTIISFLEHDRDSLILLGEGGVVVAPRRAVPAPTLAGLLAGLGFLAMTFVTKK